MSRDKLQGVYLITDTQIQDRYSHVELADAAYRAGVSLVQYRAKEKSDREALADIRKIARLESKGQQLLIVNDRPDLAGIGGADGIHLGQDDLPITAARELLGEQAIIGGTASNSEEVWTVVNTSADYVALGHIFETSTKQKDYKPRGLEMLAEVRSEVPIPLVAIGGITLQNAPDVMTAGADIIAVGSAICCADDPLRAARELVKAVE